MPIAHGFLGFSRSIARPTFAIILLGALFVWIGVSIVPYFTSDPPALDQVKSNQESYDKIEKRKDDLYISAKMKSDELRKATAEQNTPRPSGTNFPVVRNTFNESIQFPVNSMLYIVYTYSGTYEIDLFGQSSGPRYTNDYERAYYSVNYSWVALYMISGIVFVAILISWSGERNDARIERESERIPLQRGDAADNVRAILEWEIFAISNAEQRILRRSFLMLIVGVALSVGGVLAFLGIVSSNLSSAPDQKLDIPRDSSAELSLAIIRDAISYNFEISKEHKTVIDIRSIGDVVKQLTPVIDTGEKSRDFLIKTGLFTIRGTVFLIVFESIAWFFFRQYRSLQFEYQYFEKIKSRLSKQLLLVEVSNGRSETHFGGEEAELLRNILTIQILKDDENFPNEKSKQENEAEKEGDPVSRIERIIEKVSKLFSKEEKSRKEPP